MLPCFYFWGVWAAAAIWSVNVPGDFGLIMWGMLLGLLLSIFTAIRWTKWMFLIALINLFTLLFVGLRLH
jgi:hypothetical protein